MYVMSRRLFQKLVSTLVTLLAANCAMSLLGFRKQHSGSSAPVEQVVWQQNVEESFKKVLTNQMESNYSRLSIY